MKILLIAILFSVAFMPENLHANAINSSFYNSKHSKQYLTFGGRYKKEHQNRDEDFSIDYIYKSYDKIFEFEFNYDGNYRYKSKEDEVIKTKSEHEAEFSAKLRLFDSKNYFIYFHRTSYDDLAKFYYNINNLAGFGRFLFNERMAIDFAAGSSYTKHLGTDYIYRSSFSHKIDLNDNITFSQKFIFSQSFETSSTKARVEEDNQLRNQLSFKIFIHIHNPNIIIQF